MIEREISPPFLQSLPAGDCFLPKQEVRKKLGNLSNSKLYKMIADKEFPPPVKCGRSSLWLESEVDAWMGERVAERNRAHQQ